MLTSKQRAYLRGLAAKEDTIVHVGKGDLGENVIIQMKEALKAVNWSRARSLKTQRSRRTRPATCFVPSVRLRQCR